VRKALLSRFEKEQINLPWHDGKTAKLMPSDNMLAPNGMGEPGLCGKLCIKYI